MGSWFDFKCVLLGDGGVGKTTFIRRHQPCFHPQYFPTMGVVINRLAFETSRGTVMFHVWDTAGQEKFGTLRDGYYRGAHCAIIMFDLSSSMTLKNAALWYKELSRVCPGIPVVLCGNKNDLDIIKIRKQKAVSKLLDDHPYFFTSAKTDSDLTAPFLCLARNLVLDNQLEFHRVPQGL